MKWGVAFIGSVAALMCGVATGWVTTTPASTTSVRKPSNAEQKEVTPLATIKPVALAMPEMLIRLYDEWDEEGASEWMSGLSEEELLVLLQRLKSWKNETSRFHAACLAREALAKKNLPKALEEASKEIGQKKETAIGWLCGWLAASVSRKGSGFVRPAFSERNVGSLG